MEFDSSQSNLVRNPLYSRRFNDLWDAEFGILNSRGFFFLGQGSWGWLVDFGDKVSQIFLQRVLGVSDRFLDLSCLRLDERVDVLEDGLVFFHLFLDVFELLVGVAHLFLVGSFKYYKSSKPNQN